MNFVSNLGPHDILPGLFYKLYFWNKVAFSGVVSSHVFC